MPQVSQLHFQVDVKRNVAPKLKLVQSKAQKMIHLLTLQTSAMF